MKPSKEASHFVENPSAQPTLRVATGWTNDAGFTVSHSTIARKAETGKDPLQLKEARPAGTGETGTKVQKASLELSDQFCSHL